MKNCANCQGHFVMEFLWFFLRLDAVSKGFRVSLAEVTSEAMGILFSFVYPTCRRLGLLSHALRMHRP